MTFNTPIFEGTAVALVTPFTEDGSAVDFAGLAALCDMQIKAGIDALIICGTTGEASTMPDAEHVQVISEAVKAAGGKVPIIAGTGSNDTRHAVHLATEAERVGADALLVVTPYYNKTSQSGLVEHFKASASAVDLPVILYNVPSRTAMNIDPETLLRLAPVENIVGMKECNFNQLNRNMSLCGSRYHYWSGEDGLVVPLMAMGGQGVISVIANVLPELTIAMTHAWLAGDHDQARRLQVELEPLIEACFCEVNPIPVKYAMNRAGLQAGPCRLPLVSISPDHAAFVDRVLVSYDLLPGEDAVHA